MRRRIGGIGIIAGGVVGAGLVLGGCEGSGGKAVSKPGQLIRDSFELGDLRAAGNEAFALGNYPEAAELYGQYVERRPQEAGVQYQLGRTYLAMGRAQEAREHLQVAYDLDPGNEDYIEFLARAISASGSGDEMLGFLEDNAKGNMNAHGFMTLGYYAREAGYIDEAEGAYLRAAELEGHTSIEPHLHLARFYRSVGDSRSEVRSLRVAYGFDPDHAELNERLRDLGEVPGPTFALEPATTD